MTLKESEFFLKTSLDILLDIKYIDGHTRCILCGFTMGSIAIFNPATLPVAGLVSSFSRLAHVNLWWHFHPTSSQAPRVCSAFLERENNHQEAIKLRLLNGEVQVARWLLGHIPSKLVPFVASRVNLSSTHASLPPRRHSMP